MSNKLDNYQAVFFTQAIFSFFFPDYKKKETIKDFGGGASPENQVDLAQKK